MPNHVADLQAFLDEEVNRRGRILGSSRFKNHHGVVLQALGELRRRTDNAIRQAVREAAADGFSNASIGQHLGISRQAVHKQLAGTVVPFTTADDGPGED